jgi:putative addiction module component (TIGR02574 family)
MSIAEVQDLAMQLTDSDRARLAERLLQSLPPALSDEDEEELAEALARDAEMDADPSIGVSLEELNRHIQSILR